MAVTLRDFLSGGEVLTIDAAATLTMAARKMRERNVGCIVVVGSDGAVIGIFTERDLLRAVADRCNPEADAVRAHMTADPITLPPDHSPSEAAQIMTDHKFRHIPVMEEGGELVGVVSIRDLVGADLHIRPADAHVGTDFP
jgi:CBS domain-containing protein